jgi:hypothetical protein
VKAFIFEDFSMVGTFEFFEFDLDVFGPILAVVQRCIRDCSVSRTSFALQRVLFGFSCLKGNTSFTNIARKRTL